MQGEVSRGGAVQGGVSSGGTPAEHDSVRAGFAAVVAAQGPEGQGGVRALHPAPDGSRVLVACAELC